MFKEHEQIVLTDHVKGDENVDLRPGDVGTVVHIHQGGEAYIVEFMSLEGETIALATVLHSQARAVSRDDISHARTIEPPIAA
ncbi:MAG: DUF4926 domain-containing protein [Chloroflexi bacterium]|nr:DUF4926 domain-containing protein [Chloroflexota bacterium]